MNYENPYAFPKQADKNRIEQYRKYDLIYEGEHFDAFSIKTDGEFAKAYKKLRYIVANFGGLMSKVMADMLFGEPLTIDYKNKTNQDYVASLMHENSLINQLYESAILNSRRGDDLFKIRIGKRNPLDRFGQPEVILEQVSAMNYFPQFDRMAARNVATQDIIATTFADGNDTILHKETHQPGEIYHEFYKYNPQTQTIITQISASQYGFNDVEQTKVKRSLVFHIPNYRDGNYFGPSDYKDLVTLFFALNNRLTKTDNILDKHSDPILAVPPGVIDEEGKVRKEHLGMFEVDNENPGFNKPEYIVWNANLESAFTQIDKLVDLLFMMSEIAPATMGADKNGQAESGRALKFKLLSTIRKRNRKIAYYDQAIKEMLSTAQQVALAHSVPTVEGKRPADDEVPTLKWSDGIINDQVEMVEIADKRITAGISSRADEIARLDGVTPEEAKLKVKEIDEEDGPTVPAITNNTSGNNDNSDQNQDAVQE